MSLFQRRLLPILVLTMGLLAPALGIGDMGFDKQSDGQFTGLAFITGDAQWYEAFSRPEVPRFSGKTTFAPGEEGVLALIFSNAEPRNGMVEIRCDIEAFDPESTREVASDVLCYQGPLYGPNILHPASLDLRFVMGEDEPPGPAGFRITMRDAHTQRTVILEVSHIQGGQP